MQTIVNYTNQLALPLLYTKQQSIPNAVQYQIHRYSKPELWQQHNKGVFNYCYNALNKAANNVTLQFCVVANTYCNSLTTNCNNCKLLATNNCADLTPTVDVITVQYSATHLQQYAGNKQHSTLIDAVLQCSHTQAFTTSITVNNSIVTALQHIANNAYTGSAENIYFNAQAQMLLLYCMDSMSGISHTSFTCKFLATDTEREKIWKAREILLQQIGEPLTIKALSRKVAINECYLKKGFKELFGQTVFDFYHSQRMEHAKYLLYTKGATVTEVSDALGYSSISHFSTAFKKLTGIKPCELLWKQ